MAAAKGKSGVSAEVPNELRRELEERAKKEGRSRSAVITRALRFYFRHAPVVRTEDEVPSPVGGKR